MEKKQTRFFFEIYKTLRVESVDAINYTKYFVFMYAYLMEALLYPITSQIF